MPNTPNTFEPDSTITLCSVPWDASYQNVVDFTENTRNVYFNNISSSNKIVLADSCYMPVGTPIVVDVPYSVAYQYNYCFVENPPQLATEPNAMTYYYFIVGCRYNNPATVTLTLQLDVWTTYYPYTTFGSAFVERGHVAQANTSAHPAVNSGFITNALAEYMSVPEGIDVGNEFVTYYEENVSLQTNAQGVAQPDSIVIISTADMTSSFGTISNPTLTTATGGISGGLYNGCDVYVTNRAGFAQFLNSIKNYSWVAQCIVSITCVPYQIINLYTLNTVNFNGNTPSFDWYKLSSVSADRYFELDTKIDIGRVAAGGWPVVGVNPISDLRKLWTYPYAVIEITSFDGNSLFLKPQLLYADSTTLRILACAVSPFARIGIVPVYYGRSFGANGATFSVAYSDGAGSGTIQYPYGDFLDACAWIQNFPQFSIVNNNYITYMASNANTRQYAYNSAEWTLASSNMSSMTGYENTLSTIANQNANAQLDIQAQNDRFNREVSRDIVNFATDSISNIVQNPLGGIIGTVAGGVSLANNTMANYDIMRINQGLAVNQLNNNLGLEYGIANKNLELANYVSNGNYQNMIQGIEAGYADAALIPPSSVANVGGDGFRYANGLLFSFTIRYKRISDDALIRCAQYFRRFGYKINRYMMIPQYMNFCELFSYWKCQEIYIESARANETERDAIRGIMCRGTSIWGNPANIGTTSVMNNLVRSERMGAYY